MFSILSERLARLRRRYAEPHRAYHNQTHVEALLAGLAEERHRIQNMAAVELAIWYHDAIYNPSAADNEARSADLLVAEMNPLACPMMVKAAERMVRATASHELPPDLPDTWRDDTASFLDLDMAVLGAAPADYDAYEAGIATEYVPVYGPHGFRMRRSNFLRSMLSRERLFHTERFHQKLDAAARANLHRAVQDLAI